MTNETMINAAARYFRRFAGICLLALLPATSLRADEQTIQIVADNDFAVFVGNSTGITRLLYQNEAAWPDQITQAASFSISLEAGETTIYLLGMGGGGEQENISGQINGVNIATLFWQDPASVQASSDVTPYLSNYNENENVADGTYVVQLAEVQNAFAQLSWGDPDINSWQSVIQQNPYSDSVGFAFPELNSVLFKISAESLDIPTIPEPASMAFLSVFGLLLALSMSRRQRARVVA